MLDGLTTPHLLTNVPNPHQIYDGLSLFLSPGVISTYAFVCATTQKTVTKKKKTARGERVWKAPLPWLDRMDLDEQCGM